MTATLSRSGPAASSRGRTASLLVAGLIGLLVSILAATALGGEGISLVNVRDILTNHLHLTDITVFPYKEVIVWEDRMPRPSAAGSRCAA